MPSNHESSGLKWKELGEGVSVTQFPSSNRGQQIYLKKISAKKKSSHALTVFLFHDLGSYHGRFLNLTSWFRIHHPQVEFILMDFSGHGLSTGTRVHVEHFSDLVNDVSDVFHLFDKKVGEKWVALGHGLGALCLLDLVNGSNEPVKNKIDRLVLSNFVLHFNSARLQIQNKLWPNLLPGAMLMRTTRPLEIYLPEEMLGHPKEQAQYADDPLIQRKPTFQTFKTVDLKLKRLYQDAYFLDKPTLLLESVSPYLFRGGMGSFSKGFKKGLMVEKKYSNLRHDLYNEKDNVMVFNDIADWIQS